MSARKCIYCGGTVSKEHRGEHIVPEAIGGECTLTEVAAKSVCTRCNSGVLANLDRELCNRSHLSVIASQEISANLWQMWDIDHSSRDLLVEAKPYWEQSELKKLVCHPQMIFEREGPQIRGDADEMERFGKENVLEVMVRAVKSAFGRYKAGKKGTLHFERVRTNISSRNCRLPPRVYTPHSLTEIGDKIDGRSFVFRYLTAEDRAFGLNQIDKLSLSDKRNFQRSGHFFGSRVPSIAVYFDLWTVARAMMKIAFNLLAAYCETTVISSETFPTVAKLIMGKAQPEPFHLASNGFVYAEDVAALARPGCHSFRITTLENEWIIYMAFFGGRIGGAVSFGGPNQEKWNTMDILAPIHSKAWTVTKSQLYLPLRVRIEWQNPEAISPSLKLQYAQRQLLVEAGLPGRLS